MPRQGCGREKIILGVDEIANSLGYLKADLTCYPYGYHCLAKATLKYITSWIKIGLARSPLAPLLLHYRGSLRDASLQRSRWAHRVHVSGGFSIFYPFITWLLGFPRKMDKP